MPSEKASNAQSALEYLTTYGWAILIIAIVIAALFELGLFSGNTGSRARPGGCQIYRPNGPGSTEQIGLIGACTDELPEFVGSFSGSAGVNVPLNVSLLNPNEFSLTGWAELGSWNSLANRNDVISMKGGDNCGGLIATNNSKQTIWGRVSVANVYKALNGPNNAVGLGQWYFYALTYGDNDLSLYLDGSLVESEVLTGNIQWCTAPTFIGSGTPNEGDGVILYYWNGEITNVQAYGAALTAEDVTELYQEGAGGTPIQLTELIGWWPLNDNTNDYGGNDYDGNGTGTYLHYTSDYTTP